jgi:hypothetical protein
MKKYEAYYNTILCNYLREKKFYCYYELKQTNNQDFFNFAKIEKVQWEGLQATERNGLVWKFSDEISRPKPCDGLSAPPLPSYLAIKFSEEFCLIPFGEIIKLRDEGVISITKQKAEEISDKIIKV